MVRPLVALLAVALIAGGAMAHASPLSGLTAVVASMPQDAESAAIPPMPALDRQTIGQDALMIRLRPMQKEALTEELKAWMQLLSTTGEEIVAVELAALRAEGDEQAALIEQATAMKGKRTTLIDHTRLVVDKLKQRGGDVVDAELYLDATAGGLMEDLRGIASADSSALSAAGKTILAWGRSPEGGLKVLTNIGWFLATLIIAWFVARIVGAVLKRSLRRFEGTSELLRKFLTGLARKLIMLVGLIVAISMLGVNVGPLAAALGAAGLVIGLALQGTLSNFASGIMILLYRPFDIDDVVEAGGVIGKVEAMSMVSTTINTADNQKLIVPNNTIWGGVIKNITGRPTRRVDMVFGIGYGDDVDEARSVLEEILASHPKVLKDPAPTVRVHELADSSVNFVVRPWSNTADYWDVYWDITRAVKQGFDAKGISIPFPQQDVYVHQVDAN